MNERGVHFVRRGDVPIGVVSATVRPTERLQEGVGALAFLLRHLDPDAKGDGGANQADLSRGRRLLLRASAENRPKVKTVHELLAKGEGKQAKELADSCMTPAEAMHAAAMSLREWLITRGAALDYVSEIHAPFKIEHKEVIKIAAEAVSIDLAHGRSLRAMHVAAWVGLTPIHTEPLIPLALRNAEELWLLGMHDYIDGFCEALHLKEDKHLLAIVRGIRGAGEPEAGDRS